tara:strand:- start:1181 stop:2515 length:1335 start_codon:yes stop_codon:yes gene_type:complete
MIYFNNAEQAVRESISRFKENNLAKMFKLRNKLVDYYQYQSTEQYINKYFGGSLQQEIPLYTTNITKKIINRISMVYKDNPVRMYNNEQNDDITDLMLRKNYKLKSMERIHNLVGTMLVHVLWNEAEEKIEYRPILEYEVTLNPDNPMEIMSVLYPVEKTTDDIMQHQNDKFIFWSKEHHYMIDSQNKITQINEDNVNPYGILPFVTIQPNTAIDEYFNIGEGADIALANQQIDISMTMLQHHIRSAGGQMFVSGRVDTDNIKLGLNKVVVIEDGSLGTVNNSTDIGAIMEGIKHQIQHICSNHHIAFDFGIATQKSGVAIKLENLELLEAREDDVEKFRMVEKDIHKIEQKILEVEMNLALPDDFHVDFAEIDFPDPDKEMAQWDWWMKHGIKDKIDYIMEHDPDRFESREEAIQFLDERIGQRSERTNIFSLRPTGTDVDTP